MKKVLILGATGLLGNAVAEQLSGKANIIKASRNNAENPVNLADSESLKALFKKVGKVDAIVNTAGAVAFAPINASDEDWKFSIENKMMGQINTIRFGEKYLNDGGTIILTTGILGQHPMKGMGLMTVINNAVEGAVKAASIENERIRVNAISPGWITETLEAMKMDTEQGLPAKEVAKTYVQLINNDATGEVVVVMKA